MTERMINNRAKKLIELKEQIKELEAAQKALEDEIKAEFAEDQEEIKTEKYLIRWTKYTTPRLDSTKLKKELPDIYKLYTKITSGRRFSVA